MGDPDVLGPGHLSVSATLTRTKRAVWNEISRLNVESRRFESGVAMHKTAAAQVTTDHHRIRKWVDSRGGKPAAVKATHRGKDPGIIRVIFPDAPNSDD